MTSPWQRVSPSTAPFWPELDDTALDADQAVQASHASQPAEPGSGRPRQRLRVGYLSSDWNAHVSGQLHSALLALHDRTRVDVFVLATRRHDGHPIYEALRRAPDLTFRDVSGASDAAAAALIHGLDLHVLIDMNGHTVGKRIGLLSLRPAPVIVCALGYWGPCTAPWAPFLVTDPISSGLASGEGSAPPLATALDQPDDAARPVIMLPHHVLFFPRPAATALPAAVRTASAGQWALRGEPALWRTWLLPPGVPLVCNFGRALKIHPTMWRVWMAVLQRVPAAMLWLVNRDFTGSDTIVARWRAEAAAAGVSPDRLVITGLLPIDDMLKIKSACSVYLDTAPYSSHTTAGEMLYASVPVVTMLGDSVWTRVCSPQCGCPSD